MTISEDAWRETCLIAIAKQGGADVRFHSVTETVDFDIADKDIEGIALVNGGRIAKYIPQGDTTVTFEAYTNQASSSGTVGSSFWDLMNTADATQPMRVINDRVRDLYRVAVLWTADTTITDANSAVDSSDSRRWTGADGYFTSVKDDFTDGILKVTAQFKVTAFDRSGSGKMMVESSDNTGTLPALSSYTSSVKW